MQSAGFYTELTGFPIMFRCTAITIMQLQTILVLNYHKVLCNRQDPLPRFDRQTSTHGASTNVYNNNIIYKKNTHLSSRQPREQLQRSCVSIQDDQRISEEQH